MKETTANTNRIGHRRMMNPPMTNPTISNNEKSLTSGRSI